MRWDRRRVLSWVDFDTTIWNRCRGIIMTLEMKEMNKKHLNASTVSSIV